MKKNVALIFTLILFVGLVGCTSSHTLNHFEAPLAVHTDEGIEVVYRLTFPEMTEYQYNAMHSGRNLKNYETSWVNVQSDTIDGVDAFEWVDAFFNGNYEVIESDDYCMFAVELDDDYTLCYRDTRESDTDTTVSIYIE